MDNYIYNNMFQKKITGENKQKVDYSDVLLKAYQQCIKNSTQNSTIKRYELPPSYQECMRSFLEKSST